jgi:hypothetical protein
MYNPKQSQVVRLAQIPEYPSFNAVFSHFNIEIQTQNRDAINAVKTVVCPDYPTPCWAG